ncbi:MAG: hypothetical protein Harvfovirus40_18, partial [Harvfovirus sp.]
MDGYSSLGVNQCIVGGVEIGHDHCTSLEVDEMPAARRWFGTRYFGF